MTPTGNSSRWALASLALATSLSALGTSVANVALPTLAHAFNASLPHVQWVVLGYLLGMTVFLVGVGRIGDRVGPRRLLLLGIAVYILSSSLGGAAPTLGWLIAARVFQGVGASIMTAMPLALGQSISQGNVGAAMGLLGTTSAIGTALGPSLGGVLISSLHWRAAFLVNIPLGAAAYLLARYALPDERSRSPAAKPGFDYGGTVLLALALTGYALAMTLGRGHFGFLNLSLLVASAIALGIFVFAETKAASPLIRLSLFRDSSLRSGLITSGLVATVLMATLVVGPFYLSQSLGLEPALIGPVMSVGPVVAALAGVPCGRLVDRVGAHRSTLVGLGGIASGALALALLPSRYGLPAYLAPIAVVTASYALFQTANNTAVMRAAGFAQRGAISGILSLARNLGLITGASVMGTVFAQASANVAAPDAVAASCGLRATFAFAAALVAAAFAIAATCHKNADFALDPMGVERDAAHSGSTARRVEP